MKRILSYLLVIILCCSAMGIATGCDSIDLSAVNSKIEQLEKDLAAAKAIADEAKAATDKIAKLEKDLAAAKAIADEAKAATDKITQLEKDLAAAVETATGSQAEIDKLKTDLEKAIAGSSTSIDKITQLEKDLAAAVANGTSSQAEIDKLKEALKTANDKLTEMESSKPKFFYNLGDTIPFYSNGVKLFDVVLALHYCNEYNSNSAIFKINILNSKVGSNVLAFSATLFNPTTHKLAKFLISDDNELFFSYFDLETNILTLQYNGVPFAGFELDMQHTKMPPII